MWFRQARHKVRTGEGQGGFVPEEDSGPPGARFAASRAFCNATLLNIHSMNATVAVRVASVAVLHRGGGHPRHQGGSPLPC